MSVSTYLELYLTLFGWHMYAVFWDILLETGAAFLPFIGMFLNNIVDPIKSQEAKDAATLSIIDYLAFYNRRRIHSKLDYQSPLEFEREFYRKVS